MPRTLTLQIDLRDPVVMTDGSSEGQRHQSLEYIPGSSLLGAIASRFSSSDNPALFRTLFLTDETRFLNAYPALEGRRSLPLPESFLCSKEGRGPVVDRVWSPEDLRGLEALKAAFGQNILGIRNLASGFCEEKRLARVEVARGERMHVGFNSEARRAEEGQLFTYDALQPGQCFVSAIICENETAAETLLRTFKEHQELRLGRSRATGYGRVKVAVSDSAAFVEYETHSVTGDNNEHLLTMLSDYCPRQGYPLWESLIADLEDMLGSVRVLAAHTDTRLLRAFRGIWGLPRPPLVGLAKGSVLRVSCEDGASLPRLVSEGIGSRRNEGFGRVAVDWVVHHRVRADNAVGKGLLEATPCDKASSLPRLSLASIGVRGAVAPLHVLRERQKARQIDDLCTRALATKRARKFISQIAEAGSLPNHQLTNLRGMVSSSADMAAMGQWFKHIRDRRAGRKWQRIRVPSLLRANRQEHLDSVVLNELIGKQGEACLETICSLLQVKDSDAFGDLVGGPPTEKEWSRIRQGVLRKFVGGLVRAILASRNISEGARS